MTDPYQPQLTQFSFDAVETAAISAAMQTDTPWTWKPGGTHEAALTSAKAKIRAFHMQRHNSFCCYCRTNLTGAGPFMVDREHILPKGNTLYKKYTFEIWNLSVACKRCNMQYKKTKHDFVVNNTNLNALKSSSNYTLVHPNFDRWEDHLSRHSEQFNTQMMVKYSQADGSAKASNTYEFFNLKELEVDSLDRAQGRDTQPVEGKVAAEAKALARQYSQ